MSGRTRVYQSGPTIRRPGLRPGASADPDRCTPTGNSTAPGLLSRSTGDKNADLLDLPKGETRTVNVRLSFTKNAPAMAGALVPVESSEPGPGESPNSGFGPKTEFTVSVAAGTPDATRTPAPTATAPAPGVPSGPPSAAPVVPVVPVAQTAAPTQNQSASSPQAAAAPATATDARLASTGGGSSAAPMAITGATAIALGVGALVVARRRRSTQSS